MNGKNSDGLFFFPKAVFFPWKIMFPILISWFLVWVGERKIDAKHLNISFRSTSREFHALLIPSSEYFKSNLPDCRFLWFLPRKPTGCIVRSAACARTVIKGRKSEPQRYSDSLQMGKMSYWSFHPFTRQWYVFFRAQEEQDVMSESELWDCRDIILGLGKSRMKEDSLFFLVMLKTWSRLSLKARHTSCTHLSVVTASNFLPRNPGTVHCANSIRPRITTGISHRRGLNTSTTQTCISLRIDWGSFSQNGFHFACLTLNIVKIKNNLRVFI